MGHRNKNFKIICILAGNITIENDWVVPKYSFITIKLFIFKNIHDKNIFNMTAMCDIVRDSGY